MDYTFAGSSLFGLGLFPAGSPLLAGSMRKAASDMRCPVIHSPDDYLDAWIAAGIVDNKRLAIPGLQEGRQVDSQSHEAHRRAVHDQAAGRFYLLHLLLYFSRDGDFTS